MTLTLQSAKKAFKLKVLLSLTCLSVQLQGGGPIDYVDPIIGTGGHGHTFIGASVPFGAIQPGPNNIYKGWDWSSGYHISDPIIKGFSHQHLSGTGCTDLGDILIMPYTGKIKTMQGTDDNPDQGYISRYDRDTQIARPNYYAVRLADYDVRVELSATERVAIHRYTYPAKEGHIIIDLENGNNDRATDTYITKIDNNTIGGYRYSSGWAHDQRVFFVLTADQSFDDLTLYHKDDKLAKSKGKGLSMKAVISYSNLSKPVMLKVGISPVSIENAKINISTEMPGWDFEQVVEQCAGKWNKELGTIAAESKSPEVMQIFYTALYHTMIAPVLFNDSNGQYRGTDKTVYKNPGFDNYSIFSLWDTYRAEHPLLTIIQPQRVNDMVQSMLAIYKQQGILPVWHLLGNETWTMVGYHAVPVVADAYLKGFDGFDPEEAFAAMKNTAMNDRAGVKYIKEKGYIPADKEVESVAKALEYAIDDSCIALMAKKLGKKEDYEYFAKRAKYYERYFDEKTDFMRGVTSEGKWREPFDPIASRHRDDDYCEGNAWQYNWLVPHDPEGLISLFGSEAAFISKLDTMFTMSSKLGDGASSDISGLIGQYAHGNEPSHHIAYLYAYAGQQWKTAKYVRRIMKDLYKDDPDGLCGNEDCGQMSAWYILSAMGFYQVHPASGIYVLGSPALDRSEIHIPGSNNTFIIAANNNSDSNVYIESVKFNGKPYTKSYITHEMIISGGLLELEMSDEPNKNFAVKAADRPQSPK